VAGTVYCSSAADEGGVRRWLEDTGTALPVAAQLEHPDLGARMGAAMAEQLRQPGCAGVMAGARASPLPRAARLGEALQVMHLQGTCSASAGR
jgi:hypothetical protein